MSQSGGLINAFLELGNARALGFNYLISGGNEAVVNAADYLEWLTERFANAGHHLHRRGRQGRDTLSRRAGARRA